jgi:hypothetical protein
VMIGDAHHVQLDRLDSLGQLVERGSRVSRHSRVEMTINSHPSGRGGRWRPKRIQQREGD